MTIHNINSLLPTIRISWNPVFLNLITRITSRFSWQSEDAPRHFCWPRIPQPWSRRLLPSLCTVGTTPDLAAGSWKHKQVFRFTNSKQK